MVKILVMIVLFTLIMWCTLQMCILYSDNTVVLVFNVFNSLSFPGVVIVFDWMAKVFLNMVLLVSSLVLVYSYKYMEGSKVTNKFVAILSVFIVSMVVLSVSGDVFWMMVGWDGLGISSFCLIIFYQNWKSVEGGLVTFMCNRFGDLFILMSMACAMYEGLSLCVESPPLMGWLVYLLMAIGGMTKSAQAPFSAWLPLAMAAPTPVSSLVHSSTLVTAGVFLVCRFIDVFSQWCLVVVYLISSFTILLAGMSSLFEWDLKKVVALSTLVHIGMMLNVASLGSTESCLLHMTMHAFFKSMLFMAAGIAIHKSQNWQDLRRVSLDSSDANWPMMWVSILSMMGAPFMSGFCSKEVILGDCLDKSELLMSLPFWVGVGFTVAYSLRISSYLFKACSCSPLSFKHPGTFCGIVMLCGVMLSSIGNYIMWEMAWKSKFIVGLLGSGSKSFLLMVVLLGGVIGLVLSSSTSSVQFFNSMWKSASFTNIWPVLFYQSSWAVLNMFDTKGVSGRLVGSFLLLMTSSMAAMKWYFMSWPVFLLKIFLTILTTLVILGGFSD